MAWGLTKFLDFRQLAFWLLACAAMSSPKIPRLAEDGDDTESMESDEEKVPSLPSDADLPQNSAEASDNEMDMADPFIAADDDDEADDEDEDEEDSYDESTEGDNDSDQDYVPPDDEDLDALTQENEDLKQELTALRGTLRSYEHEIKKLQAQLKKLGQLKGT